jgi:hypothetical protein
LRWQVQAAFAIREPGTGNREPDKKTHPEPDRKEVSESGVQEACYQADSPLISPRVEITTWRTGRVGLTAS